MKNIIQRAIEAGGGSAHLARKIGISQPAVYSFIKRGFGNSEYIGETNYVNIILKEIKRLNEYRDQPITFTKKDLLSYSMKISKP